MRGSFALIGCGVALSAHVNPVEKVVDLLVKLRSKAEEEGKKEEVLFTKFDNFCHHQEDEKFWLSAKGAKKVDRLDTEIEDHEALIEKRTREIEKLEEEITKNNENIDTETAEQQTKSEEYAKAIADLDEVLRQCKEAISHLKASDVSGTGFLSKDMLTQAIRLTRRHGPSLKQLMAFIEEPGKPHAYKFSSQVVIELLESLVVEFKDERVAKDNEAMETRSQSEKSILQQQNLVKSQTNQKTEKQAESDENTQLKQDKQTDRDTTEKDLKANVEFIHELVGCEQVTELASTEGAKKLTDFLAGSKAPCPSEIGECGEKRKNYKARVKTRGEELVALKEAIELMKGKGGGKYSANKRLVGLVERHVSRQEAPHNRVALNVQRKQSAWEEHEWDNDEDEIDTWDSECDEENDDCNQSDEDEDDDAPDFLQLSKKDPTNKLLRFLATQAKSLKSNALGALLLKVEMRKGDHFKEVREMINGLIDRLENQLTDETEQKEWCDTQLKETHAKRTEAQMSIEEATSNIDSETAKKSLLQTEIGELRVQIAKDREAKKEQSELRTEEKEQNEQTVADAKEGLAAVSNAIGVLKTFYESAASGEELMQMSAPSGPKEGLTGPGKEGLTGPGKVEEHKEFRAKGASGTGETIADLRPESDIFESGYSGSQNESKGVIGILEVIEADYQRTVESVTANEEESEGKWKESDKTFADQIEADEGTVKEKTDAKDVADEAITENETNLSDAKTEHQSREEELENLKPLCSAATTEEQQEERRKRREQEVASLREALTILRDVK